MKKLYKSRHDVKIAGVCGGIAQYLNCDPTIVRLLTVVSMFMGWGLVAYIACAVVMPVEPSGHEYREYREEPPVDQQDPPFHN